ncbi:LytTR family transcriptional regulator DNA-binding domain-containing protein [Paenibacillus sp. L3-i20]|uniref:LytTR family transcriptional regulator DNA-binding domain-containing protein n=1 Tax=Paenibacillus sp. L3-i20 TaxID=2905833 RepID=UPI001EDCEDFE|nr:LytTR family transcriptional regulator DNA-binding domain-containing protein [Paenibacillus sp. L3-i20]GKU78540.1 transcriptional regulator [Paenibacillus sp. L3-i20]
MYNKLGQMNRKTQTINRTGDHMAILQIKELERYMENMLVFPAFHIEVAQHEVVALYSSMNVRNTLIAMLTGKLPISTGDIYVNKETFSSNRSLYLLHMGLLLLNDGHYERLTVKENFTFFKKLHGSELIIDEVIRKVKLETKTNTRLVKLSPSEKRRVQYARLLFQDPMLFVYEEPDQNVDNETKLVFQRMIRDLSASGKAVLVLTGNMETALSITSSVYRLDEKGLKAFEVHDPEDVQPSLPNEQTEIAADLPSEASEEEIDEEESFVTHVNFEKIPTRMNDKIILFNPPEIDYIESSEGQTNLYIKGEMYPTSFKINELEERLQKYGFFRCHRSYIVNLQKVKEVVTFTRNSYSLVLEDHLKTNVPLSKTKMAELKEMMGLK